MIIEEVNSKNIHNSIKNTVYIISRTLNIDAGKATKLFYSTKTSDELLNPLTKMWQEDYAYIAKLAVKEITDTHKEMCRVNEAETAKQYFIKKIAYI